MMTSEILNDKIKKIKTKSCSTIRQSTASRPRTIDYYYYWENAWTATDNPSKPE